jgi:hypothetical protein
MWKRDRQRTVRLEKAAVTLGFFWVTTLLSLRRTAALGTDSNGIPLDMDVDAGRKSGDPVMLCSFLFCGVI